MRLKCIKLVGFKSFVDPTTVNFPSNLCCVVGPNGCGKSNVIDAVRWVMGESSAKNLRGEHMTDVIFNGSSNRKPLSQASIELVFDNSDKTIKGLYAAYNEISIRRLVTRESQSTYFLNGSKCRRRDITDIFLGTGLGPRSYSIIEQGMISRLIESKPDELRVFIEEAAGISKYKERRRDTENRIKRTRENLERLTDIREELERQLQHLKRQASAAEKYTELKKDERLYKAQLQALRWKDLDDKVAVKEILIRELELTVEEKVTKQVNLDSSIEKYRVEHTDLGDEFNEVQGRFYGLGGEITRVEQSIQHTEERAQQLQDDLSQAEHSYKEAKEQLGSDLIKVEGWQAELQEIEPELELVQAAEEDSALALMSAEETMQAWQSKWDEFNETAAEPQRIVGVEQSKIQHLEQSLIRLNDKIEKLTAELSTLRTDDIDEEIDILKEQLAEAELQAEEKQSTLESLFERTESKKLSVNECTEQLNEVRGQLQSHKGRFASLEALQQAALGQSGGAVSEWLDANALSQAPRVAESVKVNDGWDVAVETVLGGYLQAVCVEGFDAVTESLDSLQQGSLSVVDTTVSGLTAAQQSSSTGTFLATKLDAPFDIGGLLSGIYAVDTLESALSMRANLAANESVITKEGIWLGANWLRVARDSDEQAGVLHRQEELETLAQTIEAQEQQVEELTETAGRDRQQLRDWEQEQQQLQRESKEVERGFAQVKSDLHTKETRIEQIAERRERASRELEEFREQMTVEHEESSQSRLILSDAIDAMEKDTALKETLLRERDESRTVLDQTRQRARHDKDRAHELAMRHQSLQTQLLSIEDSVERVKVQQERFDERCSSLGDSLQETLAPLDDMKMALEGQLEKRLLVEEKLTSARQKVQEVEHNLREAERSRSQIDQVLQSARSSLEQERLGAQEIQVRRKTLQEQLLEDEYDLETVLKEIPEEATEEKWEEELTRLANRIQRLGAINLAAIDEYKDSEERKVYLDMQNDDLESALETLENAIRKIDKETRTRFKETFDKVNTSLQELFPKVFGGGHAYLDLTGDDLLDTGVTIMARPPGKKNSTIHLLSGGEKALTAIALVFSIFKLNPAPFCMLDEVDAPLDDANVARYSRLVEEMSESVQFIFITHNKVAMEMAQQLLGVTMHEPGVSRLVAVDVEKAAELAAM